MSVTVTLSHHTSTEEAILPLKLWNESCRTLWLVCGQEWSPIWPLVECDSRGLLEPRLTCQPNDPLTMQVPSAEPFLLDTPTSQVGAKAPDKITYTGLNELFYPHTHTLLEIYFYSLHCSKFVRFTSVKSSDLWGPSMFAATIDLNNSNIISVHIINNYPKPRYQSWSWKEKNGVQTLSVSYYL